MSLLNFFILEKPLILLGNEVFVVFKMVFCETGSRLDKYEFANVFVRCNKDLIVFL